jgi:beta-glucanase (GH16 family)
MRSRGPRHAVKRFGGRGKALVAVGSTLALVSGLSTAAMVIAEPQYVAVCGGDECASTSVTASGAPAADPTVAIVPITETGSIALANHNSIGRTMVGIVGYFDSADPSTDAAAYTAADATLDLSYELASNETRSVILPDLPKAAKTVLVRLGGRAAAGTSADWQSAAYDACRSSDTSARGCRYAAIRVNASSTVTAHQVREALRRHAQHTAPPMTTPPSVTPGDNPVVDEIVDEVVRRTPSAPAAPETGAGTETGTGAAEDATQTPTVTPTEAPAPVEAAPVATSPSAPADAAAPLAGAPAGWTQVWGDEFDGSSVDTSKWTVFNNSTFGDGNNELECSMADNVTEGGGYLTITAKKLATPQACGSKDSRFPGGRSYTSGFLETKNKASFKYGRYEVRFKAPTAPGQSKGLWPAFWMRPDDGGTGELDVLEIVGTSAAEAGNANRLSQTIHYDYNGTYPQQVNVFKLNGSYDTGFHTAAVEWEPGAIRWYIDGVLTYERTKATTPWIDDAFGKNFYLRLNMAVGGNWPGTPDADTKFPADYVVDYVRVYQR